MPLYSLDDVSPILPEPGRFWIAPDAHVIGRVRLGQDVGIWFGAVLRGDNELIDVGDGTNIQEGAMLHTDMGAPLTVGAGCTVGHHAILHGCTIGDNSLIGMGATVLNHVRIGSNCLVGANALLTQGNTFPDNAHRRRPRPGGPSPRRGGGGKPALVGEALRGELAAIRQVDAADRLTRPFGVGVPEDVGRHVARTARICPHAGCGAADRLPSG